MGSGMEMDMSGEDESSKGGMWALEEKIDQPMDEEAGRLKNMYRERVTFFIDALHFFRFC
ncbi:putative potassium transporter [Helianthus annuus]|nr:putative potassium transporter [Helianthus annuus]